MPCFKLFLRQWKTSEKLMFSLFSVVRYLDFLTKSFEDIVITTILGMYLNLIHYLVTYFEVTHNKLIVYLGQLGYLVIILTSSTWSWRWCFGICWTLPYFFEILARGIIRLLETSYIINSFSTSGVKSIGLPFLGSSFFMMEAMEKMYCWVFWNQVHYLSEHRKLTKYSFYFYF